MKILVIDNNIDLAWWGAENLRRCARAATGARIEVRRGPQGDLPPDPRAYDRIIASGSKTSALENAPWIDDLQDFIRRAIEAGVPYLGVCYGHQLLCRALGGDRLMRRADVPEYGWVKVEVTAPSALLEGLPKEFHSFGAHFEEVAELPRGMRRLARSEACAIQACQLEGKPVYGIQFHPEKNVEEAERTFAERRQIGTPKHLLHPQNSRKLYRAEVSERIFGNFLGGGAT